MPERADAEGFVAAVTSDGYMLVFDAAELPELGRGKGNRLIKRPRRGTDCRDVLAGHQSLIITAGKRSMTLKPTDWEAYTGTRARRGGQLPRGLQRVDSIEAQA